MLTEKRTGHLAALFTILIWGTTFISTKILLADFKPVEILFFRFIMGWLVLLAAYPHRIKKLSRKQEMTFAAAGFCGVCLYYLLENVALTYTMASNVGVIISAAPFITAILACLFMHDKTGRAVKILGAVKTSIYIYMVPVITVITSMLILKETVTLLSVTGTILTVAGLFLSEYNRDREAKKDE